MVISLLAWIVSLLYWKVHLLYSHLSTSHSLASLQVDITWKFIFQRVTANLYVLPDPNTFSYPNLPFYIIFQTTIPSMQHPYFPNVLPQYSLVLSNPHIWRLIFPSIVCHFSKPNLQFPFPGKGMLKILKSIIPSLPFSPSLHIPSHEI